MRRLGTLVVVAALMSSSVRGETLDWMHRLGSLHSWDQGRGVSADGLGSVYISGLTEFGLEETDPQYRAAFIGKYDASGTLEWTRHIGTSESEESSNGVSADGLGSVYISGSTDGSLEGTNAGRTDVFLAKYDASGTLEWTRQFGTSSGESYKGGVSADGMGSVYIAGGTGGNLGGPNAGRGDVFLAKYDASGTLQWTRQFGTSESDSGIGVSADGLGNVYISGDTSGSLGGTNAGELDVFLAKYDASGTLEWTRQFGTSSDDKSGGVSADGLGNVYISGYTEGSLEGTNAGNWDAFLSKYDDDGTLEWTRQFGTSEMDSSEDVSADGLGNVYIAGGTGGNLGGPNAGSVDAFLSKYDASGTLQWTHQMGSILYEAFRYVSADGLGSVYSAGFDSLGNWSVIVAKFLDPLLGDVNLDGEVNGLDVDPFVEVLLSGPYQAEADMNEDGEVNGLDVDPFVAAVVGDMQQIPEPSTLLLCILALGVVSGWRKWGDVA